MVSAGDRKVLVGVLDSDFSLTHSEIQENLSNNPNEIPSDGIDNDKNGLVDDIVGYDFYNNTGALSTSDKRSHGTHVFGIATQGSKQIKGIAAAVQATGKGMIRDENIQTVSSILAIRNGMEYLIERGARVINFSLKIEESKERGVTKDDVANLRKLIEANPNVIFVSSAGNENQPLGFLKDTSSLNLHAAGLSNLWITASANKTGGLSDFSGKSSSLVAFGARGENVESVVNDTELGDMTGTSMASPQVANTAAKILLINPDLSVASVRRILALSANTGGSWMNHTQHGLINSDAAINLAALIELVHNQGVSTTDAAAKLNLHGTAAEFYLKKLVEF